MHSLCPGDEAPHRHVKVNTVFHHTFLILLLQFTSGGGSSDTAGNGK